MLKGRVTLAVQTDGVRDKSADGQVLRSTDVRKMSGTSKEAELESVENGKAPSRCRKYRDRALPNARERQRYQLVEGRSFSAILHA